MASRMAGRSARSGAVVGGRGRVGVDIYVGASAPLIAWLSSRGRLSMKVALAWNILGLLALANVVIRAVLTAPGPFNLIHTGVPNRMFGTFPFLFIPGFFVPLAVVLHTLAIRGIRSRLNTAISGAVSIDRAELETGRVIETQYSSGRVDTERLQQVLEKERGTS
jgi:hypothetical protein